MGNQIALVVIGAASAGFIGFQAWTAKQLMSQSALLAVIKKEVLPNGGSSLRDAVHRVETAVAVLEDRDIHAQ